MEVTLTDRITTRRLQWFGHVAIKETNITPYLSRHTKADGQRKRGRRRARKRDGILDEIEKRGYGWSWQRTGNAEGRLFGHIIAMEQTDRTKEEKRIICVLVSTIMVCATFWVLLVKENESLLQWWVKQKHNSTYTNKLTHILNAIWNIIINHNSLARSIALQTLSDCSPLHRSRWLVALHHSIQPPAARTLRLAPVEHLVDAVSAKLMAAVQSLWARHRTHADHTIFSVGWRHRLCSLTKIALPPFSRHIRRPSIRSGSRLRIIHHRRHAIITLGFRPASSF